MDSKQLRRMGSASVAAGALAVAVVMTPVAAQSETGVSDAWITTKTKMALLTSEGPSALRINVDTVDGRVALHGTVETAEQKAQADEPAAGVDGVRKVHNLLQVVPEEAHDVVEASDEEIADRVKAALAADEELPKGTVEVRSVNEGVVLLGGEVPRMTQHLQAIETASEVEGVRRVASQIRSPDRLADQEIWRENDATERGVTEKASDTMERAGTTASDLWTTSAVKMRLMADERTPGLDVNVDTRDGEVTLFGIVGSAEAKQAAEEDARKVSGVSVVHNQLQVVPEAKQEAVEATDEVIAESVEQALSNRSDLDEGDIGVEVRNGVARLTGTVPSHQERLLAAVTARRAPGVRAVADDLRVAN
jgi:osmotically-inducible protein OsmY